MKPCKVLLLAQGPLLRLQGPLQGLAGPLLLEGQLQTPLLLQRGAVSQLHRNTRSHCLMALEPLLQNPPPKKKNRKKGGGLNACFHCIGTILCWLVIQSILYAWKLG
jgi:hypothetical protein